MRRRIIAAALLAGVLNLQGCSSTYQTFLLGTAVGAAAMVGAVGCTLACN